MAQGDLEATRVHLALKETRDLLDQKASKAQEDCRGRRVHKEVPVRRDSKGFLDRKEIKAHLVHKGIQGLRDFKESQGLKESKARLDRVEHGRPPMASRSAMQAVRNLAM